MNCSGNESCSGSSNPFAAELFPSIVQCFSIILLGYLSARFGLLNSANGKGIGIYITTFALPAVFFQAMVTINFNDVDWLFLGAICISKVIMFALTVIIVLITSRPMSLSMAGILGIFTSQSNDVALGYPIILSLLPQQAHYIYLVAPIQLAVLNPIGFVMMEIQKYIDEKNQPVPPETAPVESETLSSSDEVVEPSMEERRRKRPWHCGDSVVWRIFVGVFFNPLVFMTLIGVPFNFLLQRNIPEMVNKALTVVAQSFAGTALFVLGFNMLGKLGNLNRRTVYLLSVLLLAKLVVTPFLMYQMVEALNPTQGNSSLQYRLFAFLYGGIPTAPPVFLFASQYHVAVDVVASGLVLGTFISFPWTYISARLVTLAAVKETDYRSLLRSTSFNISILSIVCVVWVFIIFILSRRFRRMPHMYTTMYLFSILLMCVGCLTNEIVLDQYKVQENQVLGWQAYVPFILFFVGVVGTRVWMLIIAIVLVLLKKRGLCFLLFFKWLFFLAGYGTPVLITGVLLMMAGNRLKDVDLIFQFGRSQLITSAFMLIVSLVGMVVSMVILVRHDIANSNRETESQETSPTAASSSASSSAPNVEKHWRLEASDFGSTDSDCQPLLLPAAHSKTWLSRRQIPLKQIRRTPMSNSLQSRKMEITVIDGMMEPRRPLEAPRDDGDAATVLEDNGHVIDHSDTEELVEQYDGGYDESLESWLNVRQCTLPQHNRTSEQRQMCQRNLINYRKSTRSFLQEAGEAGLGDLDKEYQTHEHTILFILAVISMFLGSMLCIWRLVNESISGVYLMLEFLDIIFSFGQGFFAFALFGLDTDLIILPFKKRWRKLLYGVEEIHLPPEANLDTEIILARQHFVRFHLQRCKKALVGRKRYRLTVYNDVFRGDHFVAWLQRVGLASNDIDAIAYGQKLLYGRVLYHVKREHHLHNLPYFYQFSKEFDNQESETEIDEGPLLVIDGGSLNSRAHHAQRRK